MRPTVITAAFAAFATLVTATTSTDAAENAAVKLWRLDCGTIQVNDLSLFSDAFDYQGRKLTLTDSCYLIAHGKDYMLWDTGLPAKLLKAPLAADAPMAPTLDRTLAEQLQAIGVTPAEIAIVGISHYHFDHLGQAADFPQARLMIGKADLDAMKMEPAPFGAEPDLVAPWLKGQSPLEPVIGDKDIYGDGSVIMLATPGHAPGSYALLVRLARMGAGAAERRHRAFRGAARDRQRATLQHRPRPVPRLDGPPQAHREDAEGRAGRAARRRGYQEAAGVSAECGVTIARPRF